MKVLFLSYLFPHKYNRFYCPFTLEHARAIHLAGTPIKVLAIHFLNASKWYDEYVEIEKDATGLEVHHVYIESLWYRWVHINPWHCYLITKRHIQRMENDFAPDIIHSNFIGVCSISAMWYAQKRKLRFVVTEHWSKIDQYMRNNKLSFLGKKAYNSADRITVVSEFLGSIVGKYTTDKTKIRRIANVIDSNLFFYKPKPRNSDNIHFAYVGYLNPPKLPMLAVLALDKVAKSTQKKIVFTLFGEGPLEKTIKALESELSYDIRLMGRTNKDIIASALQNVDYYLHPSSYETFSVAIAEALCTGTPVVASNKAAIPELITPQNGVLAGNTVDEWVRAIQEILEVEYNHQEIALSTNGKYDYLSVGEEFSKIYREVIK